nr:hypothetical protein [uncultured Pedobacter sp.]
MPYTFPVTANLELLSNYNLTALSLYEEYYHSDEVDYKNYTEEITIDFLKNETEFSEFIKTLSKELQLNNLLEQKDNLIYLYYLHFNNVTDDNIANEDYLKQAIDYIKSLKKFLKMKLKIEQELERQAILQAEKELKRQDKAKEEKKDETEDHKKNKKDKLIASYTKKISADLTLTLKSKSLPGLSISFDHPQILAVIYKSLNKSLLEANTIKSGNHFLQTAFRGKDITLELLDETQRELRFKTGTFWNKSTASFASILLYFLNQHQIHKGEGKLSNQQASLIVNLLHLFKFIDKEKIGSLDEDYIRALLNNHNLF